MKKVPRKHDAYIAHHYLPAPSRHAILIFTGQDRLYLFILALIIGAMAQELTMDGFDWHCDQITLRTPVTRAYRNTQNVRRFLIDACGPGFRFERGFVAWIKNGDPKTMGDVALEWQRRANNNTHPPL